MAYAYTSFSIAFKEENEERDEKWEKKQGDRGGGRKTSSGLKVFMLPLCGSFQESGPTGSYAATHL